jgi:small subunit ribosomal protein S9
MDIINTIGRRKAAVARVYLSEGKGNITINKRELNDYFPVSTLQYVVKQPLNLCEVAGSYDIKVNLQGGGLNGQAEALRLGISRALLKVNETEYRPKLKAAGFLTRDPREVERKKPGRPKARKRFQFSKR